MAALRGRVAAAAHRGEEAHVLLVELRLRGEAAAREVREAHARVVGPEGLALARRGAVQRRGPAQQCAQRLRLRVERVEDRGAARLGRVRAGAVQGRGGLARGGELAEQEQEQLVVHPRAESRLVGVRAGLGLEFG